MATIQALNCPNCCAPVSLNSQNCEFCGCAIVIDGISTEKSIINLLNRGAYIEAQSECRKFITSGRESAWVYYYLSIALLAGKKPFLHQRQVIDECISYLEAAERVKVFPELYLLRYYIESDYFKRKYLKRNPGYSYYLQKVKESGITLEAKETLERQLNNKIGGLS